MSRENRRNLKKVMLMPLQKLPFQPMEPLLLAEPFQDEAFRYEVKWDGVRTIAWYNEGQVRLWSRRGTDITRYFPELHVPLAWEKQVVLDGELIVVNEFRRPDFSRIVRRLRLKRPGTIQQAQQTSPAVFMVFDLLKLENTDLRSLPWWQRQERLQQVLRPSEHIQLVESFADGLGLFRQTKRWGLEGIVAKRVESRYTAGKAHRDWYKVKHWQEIDARIGGLLCNADGTWRSVYLGLPDDNGQLSFIGQAASGLTRDDWEWLTQHVSRLEMPTPPFHNLCRPDGASVWLKPHLTVTVRFQEWTAGGHLRSPVIVRLHRLSLQEWS